MLTIKTTDDSVLTMPDVNRIKDKDHALLKAGNAFKSYAANHLLEAIQLAEQNNWERAISKAERGLANLRNAQAAHANVGTILVHPYKD